MHDLWDVPALLALARDVLVSELTPLLSEERRADALLVAEAMAIAERQAEAGDGEALAILREVEMLYEPLTPALSPQCGEREGPAEREGEGQLCGALIELWRRFARDLRTGIFESSEPLDRAARAILWRVTIARLRRSNPNFLAANGFE
jgi:hypothetical protein